MNKPYLTFLSNKYFLKTSLMMLVGVTLVFSSCKKKDEDKDDMPAPPPTSTVSNADMAFVRNAALANKAEVDAGLIAASKGNHDSTRAYGRMMVIEHRMAQTELVSLARNKSISVDTAYLDPEHVALKQQLNNLNGYQFDSVYIASQIKDHTATLAKFQAHINNGQDANVKGYAAKYRPHIQMHLTKAQAIKDTIDLRK